MPCIWVPTTKPPITRTSPVMITVRTARVRARTGASSVPTTAAAASGSIHRPASAEPMPCTSIRYCGRKNIRPMNANTEITLMDTAEVNARFPNRETSIIGFAIRRWRRMNQASAAPPTARPARAVQSGAFAAVFRA